MKKNLLNAVLIAAAFMGAASASAQVCNTACNTNNCNQNYTTCAQADSLNCAVVNCNPTCTQTDSTATQQPYVVQAYNTVKNGTEISYDKVADGTENTYNTVANGTVKTYEKVKDGFKKVF